MNDNKKKRNVFYILAGSMLEHMDSMLFALYLPIVAGYFFGVQDSDTKWFLGFLAFSLYYSVRPIGALLLGLVGDKYGRKNALLLSIGMMSLATFTMGIAPSYAQAGSYAMVAFLFLRLIQGLSAGGEYGTAMTYLFETAPQDRRLFYGALLISITHIGGLIAAILANLNPEKFQYVFMIAGIIGLLSLKGRVMLTETYIRKKLEKFVFKDYLNQFRWSTYLNVIAATACAVFIFHTMMVYFNKLITQKFALDMSAALAINLMLHVIWVIFPPMIGFIGDRFQIPFPKMMRCGSIATVLIGLPILVLAYLHIHLQSFIIALILMSVSHIMFCTPKLKMICSLFVVNTRNAHVAFSYALGVSVTAALMPTINNFAYQTFGIYGIAGLMSLFAALGFISTLSQQADQ